jgi:hypothetical protein
LGVSGKTPYYPAIVWFWILIMGVK